MPTFETPEPITADVDVVHGDVRISAGAGRHTVVTVEPSDATSDDDRKVAEQTRVEYSSGRLVVKTPKLRSWLPRSAGGSVDVTIELPSGSQLHGTGGLTDFHSEGPLDEVRIKLGMGRVDVASAEALIVKSGAGDIVVERAGGHVDIAAATGDVRLRALGGTAVIKNSNGDVWVGEAHGDLRVVSANGDIAVDLANAPVSAKTANGAVRLAEVVRGAVVLETHIGDLEVGIREGTPAYLDVKATAGRVRNELEASNAPEAADERVELRARTTLGDVVIRHA
jgi:DUF4097 and DUF4098 domain-containing protein YvlB